MLGGVEVARGRREKQRRAGVLADWEQGGMPLLYYWRPDNYRRDLDWGAAYHLNQASRTMHEIELGDSLWAFTHNEQGDYVLAAELVVRAKTFNRRGFEYGRYRVWVAVVPDRTASSMVATTWSSDSQTACSQNRRTIHPPASSASVWRPSRSTFSRSLAAQKSVLE